MTSRHSFPPLVILGLAFIATGSILGLVFDRLGSVELLFGGLSLLLARDTHRSREVKFFQHHGRLYLLTFYTFAVGCSIFLLLGTLELISYGDVSPFYRLITLTLRLLGGSSILIGLGPYLVGVIKTPGKNRSP